MRGNTSSGGAVLKNATVIPQQRAAPVRREVKVRIAVAVPIAHRAAQKFAAQFAQPRRLGNIRKMSFAIPSVQCRRAANEQNIEVAVPVVVEEGAPVPDSLPDVQRSLSGNAPDVIQSRFPRDFAESRDDTRFLSLGNRRGGYSGS